MARKISKTANPKLGIYSVRLRDAKGKFTTALSKAVSFQYVLKNGDLSRKIPIPKEIKRVSERNIFVKQVLAKIHAAYNKRIEKITARKESEARKQGKKWKGTETIPVEEAVGISAKEREQIEQSGVKLEPADYYYRLNSKDLEERAKAVSRVLRKMVQEKRFFYFAQLDAIIASTEGSPTPTDKDGKYFRNKKTKKEINWYEHQKDIGLITKDSTDASIMYNVIRTLKKHFQNDFNRIKKEFSKFPRRKNIVVRVAGFTDIENHPDFLDGGDELSFDVDIRTGKRNMAERVSFNAAVKFLKLLNRDFEESQGDQGRLTSSEIVTKIRLPSSTDEKSKVKEFIFIPILYLELTNKAANVG